MPSKPPPPPAEPEVPARELTVEEKRVLFIKKLPDFKIAGDIMAIIEGMREHETVEQIIVIACRQLNGLATTKDGSAGEKRDQIRKLNGLERIIKAMDDHGSVAELYREAFALLCHLTITQSNMHKEKFGDAGGIERLLAGMQAHESDIEVQKLGCAALHNLSVVSFNADKIATACGIHRVCTAMEKHTHLDIQLHGCATLQILSICAANRSTIVAAGGVERIINAMTKHHLNIELAEFSCGALLNVGCATKEVRGKLAASGSLQSVKSAVQRAMAHPEAMGNTKTYGTMILDALTLI